MMPSWTQLRLAVFGGLLVALGQNPWSYVPVALVGLSFVLYVLANAPNPRQAGILAFAAGFGHFVLAMSWIIEPFLIEPEVYGWMAPFALFLMAAGGGVFWAVPVWLLRRLDAGLFGVALALALSDLARGYVLTGFPWALIGHIWIDTPVAQTVSVIGQTGLGFLTLAAASFAVAGFSAWRQSALSRATGFACAALLIWVAAFGFGTWRLSQPAPEGRGLTLRLVQPNAAQVGKWDPALARQHFDTLLAATAALPTVDLVIWPETALPYLIESTPEVPGMIAAASKGAPVMLGLQRVDGARGWNSLRVQDGEGALIAGYDKHHLVPFGEYIPFGDLAFEWFGLRAFAAQTGQSYSAGPGPQVLDLGPLGLVLPLICYEAVFPQDLRAAQRPDWIVQITNDAWFGTQSGPFQHAALARLRAVEQGLPLARVANTGVTQMIDAHGRITAQLPFGTQGHLDAELPGALPETFYARWGDWPITVLLTCCVLWLFRRTGKAAA
jgi:apolipoprotein N-acyltransferase